MSTHDLTHDPDGGQARTVHAGRGLAWWTDAWVLFSRSALMWVALALVLVVTYAVIGMVPMLGLVATSLAAPPFFASWMLAARKADEGGALEVADLFAAFKEPYLTPLLLQGALLLGATVAAVLLAAMLGVGAMFGMLGGGMRHSAGGMLAGLSAGLFALLIVLVAFALVTAALWFAPALVVFRRMSAIDALRESFGAVMKNFVPFFVFGLIYLLAAIVASIPLGLGWLVLAPVSLLTAYVSYRDVFGS